MPHFTKAYKNDLAINIKGQIENAQLQDVSELYQMVEDIYIENVPNINEY